MRQIALALALVLAFLPLACGNPAGEPHSGGADQTAALGTHTVACGCAVEGIGSCGNYIEVDGRFVRIANGDELGLGPMEWCGQGHLHADASGRLVDGAFVADSLTVRE